MASGGGVYFDGVTSARQAVGVEAAPDALHIRAGDGTELARWPYAELQSVPAPAGVLRLGRRGHPVLARLEIRDPALAAAIDTLAASFDRAGASERRSHARVIGWTVAAAVSLVLVGLFGLPALADRLTPLIPLSIEHRLGLAVEKQVRAMLDPGRSDGKPFICGDGSRREREGRAALERLVRRMERAAGIETPLSAVVVRRREANAVALPGGHIYVFEGLIERAANPDEFAAVLAHEIGHVVNRDGTRSVLQAAGLSFLFGMLLGDFTGGGLVVLAAKTIVQSATSREAETAADLYAVRLMAQIGGDGRALGTILERIGGATEPGMKILHDHPETKARVKAVNAAAWPSAGDPVMSPDDWVALTRICG